jgi:hypothetical protein
LKWTGGKWGSELVLTAAREEGGKNKIGQRWCGVPFIEVGRGAGDGGVLVLGAT